MKHKYKFKKKTCLPLRDFGEEYPCSFLFPYPRKLKMGRTHISLFESDIKIDHNLRNSDLVNRLITDLKEVANIVATVATEKDKFYTISLNISDSSLKPEAYRLDISPTGVEIAGQDEAGLFYGIQTFLQLAAFGQGIVPELKIEDWPTHKVRSVMIDLGRAPFSMALIKRTIRIMSRVKLNFLQLSLYNDQLMGLKFKNLPLGQENPCAIAVENLKEIVEYGEKYFVQICPELQSWGHVGSILYHYPEFYGAPGKWEGQCFAIGKPVIFLLEKIYDEVISQLANNSMVHLGLDEATWALLPGESNELSPKWLVGELHDLLMQVAKRHNKNITMRIWADHGGRPVPERIKESVILEPWGYFEFTKNKIKEKIMQYSGIEKTPFICGAGQSSTHFYGTFGATRTWSQLSADSPNCQGVNICLWEGNALDQYLLSVYAGADLVWNPSTPNIERKEDDCYNERLTGQIISKMKTWQTLFKDANEKKIIADRGEAVYRGYYLTGEKTGMPVAPTAVLNDEKRVNDITK